MRLHKAFPNNSSINIKLSKTQLYKIGQSEGFLGSLQWPLLKTGLPLIGNVLKPLTKSFLIPLELTSSISNRCSYSYRNVWIRYNNINIFKWRLEWYHENKISWRIWFFTKDVSKTTKNKAEEQKRWVSRKNLLGIILATKEVMTAGEGTFRADQDF